MKKALQGAYLTSESDEKIQESHITPFKKFLKP
jgi:hypothetical protein